MTPLTPGAALCQIRCEHVTLKTIQSLKAHLQVVKEASGRCESKLRDRETVGKRTMFVKYFIKKKEKYTFVNGMSSKGKQMNAGSARWVLLWNKNDGKQMRQREMRWVEPPLLLWP